ncbi:flippase [uncultured Methanolobus sp.]|uniref:flippase n=1 Tax=uncultured Methanolobus sp. TaxID=218300 RepID=UPI0029C861D3|nr:flippase [uncultured Methanolobus sp.]
MKDVQWSFISLATASLSHLLLRIVLGRELGPSGLGLYTLVFTIYMFGMQFSGFGIGSAVSKYVSEFKEDTQKTKEYISAGLSGSLITGFVMAFLLYFVSDMISMSIFNIPEMGYFLKLVSFCLPFIAIQKMALGTLIGFQKMKRYALINIIQNTLILILSVYLVLFLDEGVRGGILGFVIPTVITSLLSVAFVKELHIVPSFLFTGTLKKVIWFGVYVVMANTIGMINTQIDSLMVGHFMDATNVGYYAVATIIVQGMTLIPKSVHTAVMPSISYLHGKGEYNKIIKFVKKIIIIIFIIILFICLFIAFFGKTMIILLFNNDFLTAYSPLLILLIGYSIYSPIHSVDCALFSIGKVNIVYKLTLLTAICNILFNSILIPKYGILGASLATTLSLLLLSAFKFHFINKYIFALKM